MPAWSHLSPGIHLAKVGAGVLSHGDRLDTPPPPALPPTLWVGRADLSASGLWVQPVLGLSRVLPEPSPDSQGGGAPVWSPQPKPAGMPPGSTGIAGHMVGTSPLGGFLSWAGHPWEGAGPGAVAEVGSGT